MANPLANARARTGGAAYAGPPKGPAKVKSPGASRGTCSSRLGPPPTSTIYRLVVQAFGDKGEDSVNFQSLSMASGRPR